MDRLLTARTRALTGPAVVAASAGLAATVLRLRDPHTDLYVQCPFHSITGWWCPVCGGLRAVNDLTHGDVIGSLSSNILIVPLLVLTFVAWAYWFRSRWAGTTVHIPFGRTGGIATLAVLVGFTVLRNIPAGTWLAPAV